MTSQAKVSTIVSVLLHIVAFLVLAGVKIYSELTVKDEMGVEFVSLKKEMPLRRSVAVRPAMSLKQAKQNVSQEQAIVRPRHNSNVVFYTNAPQVEFSAVQSVGRIAAGHSGAMRRPAGRMNNQMIAPTEMSIAKPDSSFIQMETEVSSGRDLIQNIKPAYERTEVNDVLQHFADTIRRRIESQKRYPLAAQRSGISGEVDIRLTILRDGSLEDVVIAKSSGYEILDKAAIGSVRRASPFPPIPEESGKDKVHLTIQLLFNIT
jgi:TonB family protein